MPFFFFFYRPLLKLGLGGGAVYFIVKGGVFSDSQEETIKASKKIVDSVPGVSPYLEQVFFIILL